MGKGEGRLLPWRRLCRSCQGLQLNAQALSGGLVKLHDYVGRFKSRRLNVQRMLADGKLEWPELVGRASESTVERDARLGRIGRDDQGSHAVPFVTGVGIAASRARILVGIRVRQRIVRKRRRRHVVTITAVQPSPAMDRSGVIELVRARPAPAALCEERNTNQRQYQC